MMTTHEHSLFTILLFFSIAYKVSSVYENVSLSENVYQKNSKVLYANPKYMRDFSVLTYRISRRSPYLTTFNVTTLTPWDNSYMVETEVFNHDLKLEIMRVSVKACDIISLRWLSDWIKRHSDVPVVCPIPAGNYHVLRAELPPKNIPLPKMIPGGLYSCHLNGYHVLNSTHRELLYKMLLELTFKGT